MDDPDRLLCDAIHSVGSSFVQDELAYLALTSKPEQHFRDRIAFNLYRQLENEAVLVCREWNRIDLAVIAAADQKPIILVELKWMYSMDAWADRSDYYQAVLLDEAKALRIAAPDTAVYTLLLATHPKANIPAQFWPTIKYASNVNRHLLLAGTAEKIAQQAVMAASKLLGTHRICSSGDIDGGSAYGIPASVMWWLMKADARTQPF